MTVARASRLAALGGGTALVTGGASGLGLAYARHLARLGMHVVVTSRYADRLAAAADHLGTEGAASVRTMVVDLAQVGAAQQIIGGFPEVDLLVCNAGRGSPGAVADLDAEEAASTVAVNCLAPAHLSAGYLPRMVAQGRGGIIYVSSMMAFAGLPVMGHYSATKAYLLSLGQAVEAENRHLGVVTQVVCPGPIATPALDRYPIDLRHLPLPILTADAVVTASLAAFGTGLVCVPGVRPRLAAMALDQPLLRPLARWLAGRWARRIAGLPR